MPQGMCDCVLSLLCAGMKKLLRIPSGATPISATAQAQPPASSSPPEVAVGVRARVHVGMYIHVAAPTYLFCQTLSLYIWECMRLTCVC